MYWARTHAEIQHHRLTMHPVVPTGQDLRSHDDVVPVTRVNY
jgi:hypothetical protein